MGEIIAAPSRKSGQQGGFHLYVIATHHDGKWTAPIKVGITRHLRTRLAQIRTGCPYPATIYQHWEYLVAGQARQIESAFHHCQAEHRLSGEWFSLEPRVACFLIELYHRITVNMAGVPADEVDRLMGPIAPAIPADPVWA